MKKILLILVLVVTVGISSNPISNDCKFNGKKLSGKVRIVQAFGDVKVRAVQAFEDIKVLNLSYASSLASCGEWTFVQAGEDFTIQFVEAFEDLKIRFVQAFPGIN
ncbi:MAG TPA: hypothetical protein PK079_25125 [Leptospiraceae bacterium]|nr:hypothetical protein [Leptospiraceae bacterium]HMW08585.1 hypothetical protein [Leptospiraceae bacterium]HMZ66544.1 hypothetical protein [Leptospiraceae bacterium]HNA10236.1 hypothetical protein [Leptospiraceae bacterium]HNB98548.1 hypothetical protein [Leptospiraceae bacterium]